MKAILKALVSIVALSLIAAGVFLMVIMAPTLIAFDPALAAVVAMIGGTLAMMFLLITN